MADTKIASLTDGLTTSGTDRIPVAISPYGSGNNAYITPSYLKTFMVTGGTVTSSTPVFDMTQRWNSGAVTFSGLKLDITDTASASGSLLMDLQVDGSSKFTVRKDGAVSGTTFDLLSGFGGISNSGGPWAASSGRMAFGGNFAGPFLQYDGNNSTLGLRDGTNAQTLNIYNTWSSAGANYERGFQGWGGTSNLYILTVSKSGTGVQRNLKLGGNETGSHGGIAGIKLWTDGTIEFQGISTSLWSFTTGGHLTAATDNVYDIGASGANRPRSIFVGTNITAAGSITTSGDSFFANGSDKGIKVGGAAWVTGPSADVLKLSNSAFTGAPLVVFGGTTSSFPALKRSTASLHVRLADDHDFAELVFKLPTSNPGPGTLWNNAGVLTIGT